MLLGLTHDRQHFSHPGGPGPLLSIKMNPTYQPGSTPPLLLTGLRAARTSRCCSSTRLVSSLFQVTPLLGPV